LKNVNSRLVEKYRQLNAKMDNYEQVLAGYQVTDDSVYRCILDADPIPAYSRQPGFGGTDRYENLEGYPSSPLMIRTSLRLDQIEMRTTLQNSSFTDLDRMALSRRSMLGSIPAIQPVAIDATYWLSSDFGYRIDPFTHMRAFHNGLDFAAEPGLNVYSTGDGVVDFVSSSRYGYGLEIMIDHGFGYSSRYAHLKKILVEPGQKVTRGQLIGLLGNSGRSTGPHLHYGVNYFGKAVNPYFYYSNDLTPKEYNKILSLSE
jgi:murein DD-endopeptidase MepM/ murein hydrolase activator NlpD